MQPGRNMGAVVVGTSAGGFDALSQLFSEIPSDFELSILAVQHLSDNCDINFIVDRLSEQCSLTVKEATEKKALQKGLIFLAPPDYHLLVEQDYSLSLSTDDKVNFSRPSIDVLFESAAIVFGNSLIGIILTGASNDGARGAQRIKKEGGIVLVEDPQSAEFPYMPQAAINACRPDHILKVKDIGAILPSIVKDRKPSSPQE